MIPPVFILFIFAVTRRILAQGNWTTSPFNPPSMPLAVKSPYVNIWAPLGFNTTGSAAINKAWPRAWDQSLRILEWYASIRVDGKPYNLLGQAAVPVIESAIQDSFVFTPTRSSYLLQAGTVNVNLTFMTPIEATDLVRQSMPFSYLYFDIESNDGNTHDVEIYSDISGEWITGDTGLDASWSINESNDFVYLQMELTSPVPFQELNNMPQDATLYYCANKSDGVSWQIGPSDDIRSFFANGTGLQDIAEQGTHSVGSPLDTLGIAINLGNITSTSEPVAYALGVVRDPVIQYTNHLVQQEQRSAYYWSEFTNIHDVIQDVLDHFVDTLSAATSLDSQILNAAGQISNEYAEILSLCTRQAMGALEYTLLKSDGSYNTSDVKAFMKDMGGIGSGGVNAVDVLYASMPVYLYFNPAILGYLLSPLMEYQESIQYVNTYAAEDLGGSFPNATGNPSSHNQGIEHSASMIIMSLAHAQASGDGSLLVQHYDLLNEWASYLVNNTMNPDNQTTSSSDGITSKNQTNLALKGIIGIGAMAKISEYTGHSDDRSYYNDTAKQFVQQWTSLATASGQVALNFGSGSSGLIYNLYADKLLQLNLIDSSIYDLQASFYQEQLGIRKYGIPLDSSNPSSVSRSDWMMFAASSVSNTSVREAMISQMHAYASVNINQNLPFPVSYFPQNGSMANGENSPAQGAMFAPLALNIPIKQVTFNGSSNNRGGATAAETSRHSRNVGAIVGATVGSLAGLTIVAGILAFLCLRKKRTRRGRYNHTKNIEPAVPPSSAAIDLLRRPTIQNEMKGPAARLYQQTSSYTSDKDRITTIGPTEITTSQSRGSETEGWRSAVGHLQREIEQLRAERSGVADAPPSYSDGIPEAL